MLGSQKKEEGASGASGSGVASTARDLASKAVAIVPFSNLSEAIEVGRAKTEAQNARAAASEARDRDDPTIAFRDHDSARAWENRKSESIEHREKIKNKRASVRRDPTEKRLEKYMMGLGSRVQGGEQTAQKLKPLTPVFAFILHGLYYGTKYLLIVFDYAWQLYEIVRPLARARAARRAAAAVVARTRPRLESPAAGGSPRGHPAPLVPRPTRASHGGILRRRWPHAPRAPHVLLPLFGRPSLLAAPTRPRPPPAPRPPPGPSPGTARPSGGARGLARHLARALRVACEECGDARVQPGGRGHRRAGAMRVTHTLRAPVPTRQTRAVCPSTTVRATGPQSVRPSHAHAHWRTLAAHHPHPPHFLKTHRQMHSCQRRR